MSRMSSIEVVVRGSWIGEVVRLRPYLTKATSHTRISSRLATKLRLTEFRDIYIRVCVTKSCRLQVEKWSWFGGRSISQGRNLPSTHVEVKIEWL